MSVRLIKYGVADDDHYEMVFRDGDVFSVARFHGRAMRLAHARGERAIFEMIAMEVGGVLSGFDARRRNVPYLGAMVTLDDDPARFSIVGIDRDTNTVMLAKPDGDRATAPWARCRWA